MKSTLIAIYIFFVSLLHSVAQEQLTVRTVLNTSKGKALGEISVTINGTGNLSTNSSGFATFPNLKNSHAKTSGDAINLYVKNVNYALVNHYDLRNYILPKDRNMPVEIILAKNEEKDKYIKQHLIYIIEISLKKDLDKKEGELNKEMGKYIDATEKLAQDSKKELEGLMYKIDSLNKQLDFIQKQQVEKTNISEQIADILAQTSQPDASLLNTYAHISQGNFELALKALKPSQIDQERLDYENEEKLAHVTLAKEKKKNYIAKCLLKAKLYGLVPKIDSSEIWFEKAYQADTNNANTLLAYAYFLSEQNSLKRSAELYERALQIYEALAKDNPKQYLPDVAMTLNNLGIVYEINKLKAEPLNAYERALNIYEALAKDNPEQYLSDVAMTLKNLGDFYADNNLKEKAQNAYEKVLQIYESLAKDNPTKYMPNMAMTSHHLGFFYKDNNLKEQAQNAYERALQIYESLAKDNPDQYLPDLAMTLNNLGIFYKDNNLNVKAQNAHERALTIRESLARANPNKYLPFVATTLYNLGIFYKDNNLKEKAQNAYEKALMIYEVFVKINPKHYLLEVAKTLNNLGILYQDNHLKEKAKNAYERALMIYEAFAKVNPKQYLPYLAQLQVNYAVFWADENEINKTEEWMIKGLKSYQTIAILLKDDYLWQKSKPIKDILLELIANDSIYQHKLNLEKAIIDFNSQYPLASNEEKVSALGNGAWFALFCKEYQLSEDYSRKGLAIAPEQHWLYTNLALALLLQNRWNEAKQIYQEKQNLTDNDNKPLKDSFLNDLIALEKAGIKHPDFEKVRALLK